MIKQKISTLQIKIKQLTTLPVAILFVWVLMSHTPNKNPPFRLMDYVYGLAMGYILISTSSYCAMSIVSPLERGAFGYFDIRNLFKKGPIKAGEYRSLIPLRLFAFFAWLGLFGAVLFPQGWMMIRYLFNIALQ